MNVKAGDEVAAVTKLNSVRLKGPDNKRRDSCKSEKISIAQIARIINVEKCLHRAANGLDSSDFF